MRRKRNTVDDLMEYIEIDNKTKCWNWKGAKHVQNYNMCRFKGVMGRTERFIKMETEGVQLNHADRVTNTCGNSDCVNPDHHKIMWAGSYEYPHGPRPTRFTQQEANNLKNEYDNIPDKWGKRINFKRKYKISDCMLRKIIDGTYKSNRG